LDWLAGVGAPASAGQGTKQLQQQLAAVHVSAGSMSSSTSRSSSLSSSYFSTGSIGAVPRGGIYNSQQVKKASSVCLTCYQLPAIRTTGHPTAQPASRILHAHVVGRHPTCTQQISAVFFKGSVHCRGAPRHCRTVSN
jgi:hypothetical protein